MDSYQTYMRSIQKYPTYSHANSTQHYETIEQEYDSLIHGNLKLVAKIASEHANLWPSFDIMDLIQEGNMALVKCVKSYKKERGSFPTFLGFCVRVAIMRYIKDNTGALRLYKTKSQRTIFNNLTTIYSKYKESGSSLSELADEFDVTVPDLELILGTYNPVDIESIKIDSPEDKMIVDEDVMVIRTRISDFRDTLTRAQKEVFDRTMYTGTESLQSCSVSMGTSRAAVWNIKRRILKKAVDFFTTADLKRIQTGEVD